MKPYLATDWDPTAVKFPLIAMPKIDGVRGLNVEGQLVGRSLKPHANKAVTALLSLSQFTGLDGELAADRPTAPALCRDTTSLTISVHAEPTDKFAWWLFDYMTPEVAQAPYIDRLTFLRRKAALVAKRTPLVQLVPWVAVETMAQLLDLEAQWLDEGYEGVILRDPAAPYKYGRSTVREGGFLRIKRFVVEEGVVVSIAEGRENRNAAKVNALGHTERSTHAENMVPNGQVGSMEVRMLKTKQVVTVSAGCLTRPQRIAYLQRPDLIVGHVIKVKFFPHGVKDKPRFPTYVSHRSAVDMSE